MREFGPEAYFVHYPSKFLDKSVEYLGGESGRHANSLLQSPMHRLIVV